MRFFILFLLYAAYYCNCTTSNAEIEGEPGKSDQDTTLKPSNAEREGEPEKSDEDTTLKPLRYPANYNSFEDVKRILNTLGLKFFVNEPLRKKQSTFQKVWNSLPWRTKYKDELKG